MFYLSLPHAAKEKVSGTEIITGSGISRMAFGIHLGMVLHLDVSGLSPSDKSYKDIEAMAGRATE